MRVYQDSCIERKSSKLFKVESSQKLYPIKNRKHYYSDGIKSVITFSCLVEESRLTLSSSSRARTVGSCNGAVHLVDLLDLPRQIFKARSTPFLVYEILHPPPSPTPTITLSPADLLHRNKVFKQTPLVQQRTPLFQVSR